MYIKKKVNLALHQIDVGVQLYMNRIVVCGLLGGVTP